MTINQRPRGNTTRDEWLRACDDARREMKGSFDPEQNRALRALIGRLSGCGSKVGALVCPECERSQPGSGDLASANHGVLCGLAGCPLCRAEDHALRANTLANGLKLMNARGAREIKRLWRMVHASTQKSTRRKPAPKYTRGDSPAARRAAAPMQLVRLNNCHWYVFEVARSYDPAASAPHLLRRFTGAAEGFHELVRTLWNDHVAGDRGKRDVAALGAWIEPPVDGWVRQRGVFFAPEFLREEFDRRLHDISPRAVVRRLHAINPDQRVAWAQVLAGDPPHAADAASFAEEWLQNQPHALPRPDLAILWSLAVVEANCEWARSDGLMREHYRLVNDDTRPARAKISVCMYCQTEARFLEQRRNSAHYLGKCAKLEVPPFAPRTLPVVLKDTSAKYVVPKSRSSIL